MRNIMLINIDPLKFANRDVVLPEIPLSTYVHELIHWMDAKEYEQKKGRIRDIEDYQSYLHWIRQKGKQILEKLTRSGYNINKISKYASDSIENEKYDEFYTEYRVLQFLKKKRG